MEIVGIEPTTFALSEQHSTTEIYFPALSFECAISKLMLILYIFISMCIIINFSYEIKIN